MNDKIIETRRVLFEKWVKTFALTEDKRLSKDENNKYFDDWIQCRWFGFNAALDAVEIELPDAGDVLCRDTVDACRTAIESTNLGLKVK